MMGPQVFRQLQVCQLRSICQSLHRGHKALLNGRLTCGSTYPSSELLRIPSLQSSPVYYSTKGTEQPISRYPIPDRNSLPSDIQEQMKEVEEKGGFLPNVFSCLSYRPEEFRAFFNYYDVLMNKETGSLTKAEKEMIIVATSAANHCQYCVVAHGALHRIYSKRPLVADQLACNWEGADLTERERAILAFATKVGRSQHLVDEDFVALQQQGLTKEDAWDIGAIAAFFALSNRMAHLAGMRPNDEFYTMGRTPRQKEEQK